MIDLGNGADTFSNVTLEAGVWYCPRSALTLKPDSGWAAVNLPHLLDERGTHLGGTSPEDLE